MSAELRILEPISVVGIDHIGPYHEIGGTFGRICGMAGQLGWPMRGALAIYYDDPRETPPESLRSAACVVVPAGFDPGTEGVRAFSIEGGSHAVLRYVGPYDKLGDVWARLYSEELPALGMDDAGAPFEIYVSHPEEGSGEQPVTDLCVPVKQRT